MGPQWVAREHLNYLAEAERQQMSRGKMWNEGEGFGSRERRAHLRFRMLLQTSSPQTAPLGLAHMLKSQTCIDVCYTEVL